MDPVIGAAAIGAASNFVGNLFGKKSQSDANKMNYKIAQMNNQFNEHMFERQIKYNTEMWNKENEYNSASNQRKRLEEAGLNPYLMMNGGSAGSASSAGGVTPPSAQAASMGAYKPDMSGFVSASSMLGDYFANKDLRDAQASSQRANAFAALQAGNDSLAFRGFKIHGMKLQNEANKITNSFLPTMQANTVSQQLAEIDLLKNKAAESMANTLLTNKNIASFDSRLQSELALRAAQSYQAIQSGTLARNDAKVSLQKQILTYYQAKGQKVSNKIAKATADSLIMQAQLAADKDAYQLELDKKFGKWERGASVVGNTVGAIGSAMLPLGIFKGLKGLKAAKGVSRFGLPHSTDRQYHPYRYKENP